MARRKYTLFAILLLVTIIFAVTAALTWVKVDHASLFQRIDYPVHDRLFRIRNYLSRKGTLAAQPISTEITLIGIDDITHQELGQFGKGTWLTRGPFISQIEYLRNIYNPAIVAYDLIFSEFEEARQRQGSSTLSSDELKNITREIQNLVVGRTTEIPNDILTNIARLTSVQGSSNLATALSTFLSGQERSTVPIIAYDSTDPDKSKTWSIEAILGNDQSDLREENGTHLPYLKDVSIPIEYVRNLPADYRFTQHATIPTTSLLDYAKLGFVNVPRDEGGTVRRVPLIHGMEYRYIHPYTEEEIHQRFFLPSFAFLCCLYYWGIDLVELNVTGSFEKGGEAVVEIILGDHIVVRKPDNETLRIPIDHDGRFFLDFVGGVKDFNNVSFSNVGPPTAYKEVRDLLHRKIALVGLTATGSTDTGPTPISDHSPFVLVHMMAINNMLKQTFTRPLEASGQLIILTILWLIALPMSILLRPMKFTYFTLLFTVIYGSLVLFFLFTHQYTLPVSGPLTLIVGAYLPVLLCYYFSEVKEKKKIRGMFSTMVSGEVLEYLENNPQSFSLAGSRMEATMFFSDIAGFTTISESLSPEKLVDLLNRYLSPMTEIIMESHGYVDKYEGDAIMAEWGVPFHNEDHAKLACWAALDQQKRISELRPKFIEEFGVDICVRMGLNSGAVSAGNMGSQKRMSYTVMGDAVNQAARFEPANKEYGTSILIGQSTFELAKNHIEVRLIDKLVVKGKTVPIAIYELFSKKEGLTSSQQKVIQLYNDGLSFHWERKWNDALGCLNKALAITPNDGPSLALIQRIKQYELKPPPPDWKGEYTRFVKD